jgi:uncharacterized protein (DUF1810 family)
MKNIINQQGVSPLEKFITAQQRDYRIAFNEISRGRKQSHWMWYIFPQIQGLGFSDTAKCYAIADLKEAGAFLTHPVLGSRLVEISSLLLNHRRLSANEIFGSPDDMKLRSCMSLFAAVKNAPVVFDQVINQFFSGEGDPKTKRILELQA